MQLGGRLRSDQVGREGCVNLLSERRRVSRRIAAQKAKASSAHLYFFVSLELELDNLDVRLLEAATERDDGG